jgi:hypothetical protein
MRGPRVATRRKRGASRLVHQDGDDRSGSGDAISVVDARFER